MLNETYIIYIESKSLSKTQKIIREKKIVTIFHYFSRKKACVITDSEFFCSQIPIIKRAQSFSDKELKLIATCWSPPTWMKTNHQLAGFGFLKEEYYRAYADYHIK